MNLDEVDAAAWAKLEAATGDPKSGFRYVTLCSVDAAGRPQARLVVLRRVDVGSRTLEFHTDTRSAKWQELASKPFATVLGFSPEDQLQLRLQGRVELHEPGSELASKAWERLSPWTRKTYTGGPPGDEPAVGGDDETSVPETLGSGEGQSVFGLLLFRAAEMDWFQLQRPDNRRALFAYDQRGALAAGRWVNP